MKNILIIGAVLYGLYLYKKSKETAAGAAASADGGGSSGGGGGGGGYSYGSGASSNPVAPIVVPASSLVVSTKKVAPSNLVKNNKG